MINAGGVYRIIADQLGSPRLIVGIATGAIAEQVDYWKQRLHGPLANEAVPTPGRVLSVRQSVYSSIAGYEDVNDVDCLSQDPAFRLIGSEKVWDRGVALTSRLQTFETEIWPRRRILLRCRQSFSVN